MGTTQARLDRLRALAKRIPLVGSPYPLAEPSFAPGATGDQIDALEARVGAPLPHEYRELLRMCGGVLAMDVWNGYALHGPAQVERDLASDHLPHLGSGGTLVPFGSDGGGNIFLISLPAGSVMKWRHDIWTSPFVEVAPSFTRFLDRMASDWEHFIEGDENWEYMAG